jgi:perosamine synthetase
MISVCEPFLNGKEKEYVLDCLSSNWISSNGKYLQQFEQEFAKYSGCKYGIATTSGTTALHIALASLEIGKGDEVIVPTFTMAACAFSVLYVGATPVFVDCEPDTWCIDVKKIVSRITSRTRAIMPVHIYGHTCEMDSIRKLAQRENLVVIEDAAEAHGAEYRGRKAGGLGDIGCFSFYANKIITTGEGGMVVTNNDKYADTARRLKDLAHSKEQRFYHTEVGFNYRMTNISAAIGLAQLEKIDEYVERRRCHAQLYSQLLKDVEGITLPVQRLGCKNVYWMYAILVDKGRNKVMEWLKEKGIQTRAFFVPMHKQPMFANYYNEKEFPVANDISQRGLYLPSGSGLRGEDIEYICKCVKEVISEG